MMRPEENAKVPFSRLARTSILVKDGLFPHQPGNNSIWVEVKTLVIPVKAPKCPWQQMDSRIQENGLLVRWYSQTRLCRRVEKRAGSIKTP